MELALDKASQLVSRMDLSIVVPVGREISTQQQSMGAYVNPEQLLGFLDTK